MPTDDIPESDLPISAAAYTDYVRIVRNGQSLRALAVDLPIPRAAQAQITAIADGQSAGQLVYQTWAELAAKTASDGVGAQVINDTGTHTDPVVGGTVANTGQYTWSASPAGWKWVRADGLALKADGAEMDGRVASAAAVSGTVRIPVAVSGGNVLVWLENGALQVAAGLGAGLLAQINSSLIANALRIVGNEANPMRSPLAIAGATVPIWTSSEGIGFVKLDASTTARLRDQLGIGTTVTAASPATDGRTLRKWRAKVGKYQSGLQPTVLRVGISGDSWTEFRTIPEAIRNRLLSQYDASGDGFIGLKPGIQQLLTTTNMVSAGWTAYDASDAQTTAPPRSCGPDGHAIYTTGSTATLSIAGLTGTDLTIGYWNGNGTFRYRVDGAAWTSVTGSEGNAPATVAISGLGAGSHKLEIDTTENTGTCELYFVLSERPATNGLTMFKIGNGSMTGQGYTTIKAHVQQWSALLNLDLLLVILGTNDSRSGYTFANAANYSTGIADLVAAHRSANPLLPVIFLIPPMHGDNVGPGAISDYWQAAHDRCSALGIECYRACNTWGLWADENAQQMWVDQLHLLTAGGNRLANEIHHEFLEI